MVIRQIFFSSFLLLLLLCVGNGAAGSFDSEAEHVIVVMKEQPESVEKPHDIALFAADSQKGVVASLQCMGAGEVTSLWSVNALATTLTPDQQQIVSARDDVALVVPDRIIMLDEVGSSGDKKTTLRFFTPFSSAVESIDPSGYDRDDIAWSVSWIEAPAVWDSGIDGTGVTVAVVDTGIYANHPDLEGKVVGWVDLVNGRADPYDDHGHGTHCAGTIAGTGAGGTATGVAPGADLIGIKVFSKEGSAFTSTVIEGFETAVLLGADVISYSGGSIGFDTFSWSGSLNSTGEVDLTFDITNEGDGFDPSFVLVWAYTLFQDDLTVTMRKPDGSAYPGVSCDWFESPLSSGEILLKYTGDEPLPEGEWTLHLAGNPVNESNLVWYSGKGNDLDNSLSKRFNLTDQADDLESLTFELYSWYEIETNWDYGFVEVWSEEHDQWVQVLTYSGVGEGLSSVDLMDYIFQTDGGMTVLDLRLRYETDESVVWQGWYIDWMAIPEIGYYDDASDDQGWIADPADGWSRIYEERPISIEWFIFYVDNGSSLVSRASDAIVSDGTTIVTSAGNSGEFGLRTIGGPAAAEKVIAVGATDYFMDYIAYYSSRGPSGWGDDLRIKPDVVAPGSYVISASTRDGELYRSMSGTSMACPHVSGIAALLLQVDSGLAPADIMSALTTTAVDPSDEGPGMTYGYGRVSAWAAVNAVHPLDPPVYNGPRLHAGFGYRYLKHGERNTITAISWDQLPSPAEPIHFLVWNEAGERLNSTVLTDDSGLATASFLPYGGRYEYQVSDSHGNSVSGWIAALSVDPKPLLLIDTPRKDYEAPADSIIPIRYLIVNPETMEPYSDDLRVVIRHNDEEYLNEVLTPVNGMIHLAVDGSAIPSLQGSIEISPLADESQVLYAGSIDLVESEGTITLMTPPIIRAVSGGNARFLVKEYSRLNARPAPDRERELLVAWLSEADVYTLSKQFPLRMSRLLEGDASMSSHELDEISAEIENMQTEVTYVPYQLRYGIGKVDLQVPDDAYLGYVFGGIGISIVVVDLWPYIHHEQAPPAEPSRSLSVTGVWGGDYSPESGHIVPHDEVHVTCYLTDPITGSPVQGVVHLYTADQYKRVVTGAGGYGYATFPASIRFADDLEKNMFQIVGLSGDSYHYDYVYPPSERVVMSSDYAEGVDGGVISATVSILGPEVTDWPAIFEVSRKDIYGYDFLPAAYPTGAATIFSAHIGGMGEYEEFLPYGSYQIAVNLKDYFSRGEYSQGNWQRYTKTIGSTPLVVESPPPSMIDRPGDVAVRVRMAGGEPGVPVYLAYASEPLYSLFFTDVDSFSDYGGVDVKTTGADGRATLRMTIPEDGYLWWEIGGGTPDLVFTTLSGYSIQQTPVSPTSGEGPGGRETAVAPGVVAGADTVLTYSGPSINSISFVAGSDINAAIITVDRVRNLPHGVPEPVPEVYQYFDITPHPNTLPHIREDVEIFFHIPAGYLTSMGMGMTDAALMRYVDGSWEMLPTAYVGLDGDLAHYRATTPGLSLFAIVLQKGGAVVEPADPDPVVMDEPVVKEDATPDSVDEGDEDRVVVVPETPFAPAPPPDEPEPAPAPILYAPAGLVAAALFVFACRRRV